MEKQARRLVVVDQELIFCLGHFLSSLETVFGDPDWEVTKDNITSEFLIVPHGTFLEPGVKDESDNWGNRGALLADHRALLEALKQPQIRVLDDPHGLIAYELSRRLAQQCHDAGTAAPDLCLLADAFLQIGARSHDGSIEAIAVRKALMATITWAWPHILAAAKNQLRAADATPTRTAQPRAPLPAEM